MLLLIGVAVRRFRQGQSPKFNKRLDAFKAFGLLRFVFLTSANTEPAAFKAGS